MGLLLAGLAGCTSKSERFQEKPATFWDGIWYGAIAPWSLSPAYRSEPARSTPGYKWGVGLGAAWTFLWIVRGTVAAINENGYSGCLFGLLGGYLFGILLGALIYWSIYALLAYLLQNVNSWFEWLIGGYDEKPATFWNGIWHGVE